MPESHPGPSAGPRLSVLAYPAGREEVRLLREWQDRPTGLLVVGRSGLRAAAACRILVAQRITPELVALLRSLQYQDAGTPSVLLTGASTENLFRLADIVVDAVADIEAMDTWRGAVEAVLGGDQLRQLAGRIRAAATIPEYIRIALFRLAGARPPIASVRELAATLHCSEATLRRHWPRQRTQWRLEDLVDWFVLHYYGWETGPRDPAAGRRRPASRTLNAMCLRLLSAERRAIPRPPLASHEMLTELLGEASAQNDQ